MNILLVTSFFPPTRTAGTEERTFAYAIELSERGHQVQVLCAGQYEEGATHYWNGYTDEIYQGVPVRRIHLFWQKSPDPNAYLYKNPQTARFLQKCLSEWHPDIVHITSCLTLSASIIGAAKEWGIPVILTLTDFWFLCHKLSLLKYDGSLCDSITSSRECIQCLSWGSSIYRQLKKFSSEAIAARALDILSRMRTPSRMRALRGMAPNIRQRKAYLAEMLNMADVLVAPSNHLRETMYRSGVGKEIRVIQSGHDLSRLDRAMQKTPSRRVRFGYIGQFIPAKGVHILLSAFGSCTWQGKAELHLFGDMRASPDYWQRLQQIENCNHQAVFFHGPFPHEQLSPVFAGLDILVVPSLWYENNPRVIQEAFASGMPVIASDVGGISEYVQHGVNGLLFRRGDSVDLAGQIRRIVDDPREIARLGANLPAVKNIHDEVEEIESVYRELISRSLIRPLSIET